MKPESEKLTPAQARVKIERYCAYQERCHKEVTEKLYAYGLHSDDVALLLSELVRKGFLNEERFAIAFAGGKFRQKKWGRKKIISELKQRGISPYCINKALAEISPEDYGESLQKTAEKYASTLKGGSLYERKQKILKYLHGRGYEYEECHEILNAVLQTE